jgi:hypothetical protein
MAGIMGRSFQIGILKATLFLNHPVDDQFLRKGMRILVSGYEEWGDEGGSWSKHASIKVIK